MNRKGRKKASGWMEALTVGRACNVLQVETEGAFDSPWRGELRGICATAVPATGTEISVVGGKRNLISITLHCHHLFGIGQMLPSLVDAS